MIYREAYKFNFACLNTIGSLSWLLPHVTGSESKNCIECLQCESNITCNLPPLAWLFGCGPYLRSICTCSFSVLNFFICQWFSVKLLITHQLLMQWKETNYFVGGLWRLLSFCLVSTYLNFIIVFMSFFSWRGSLTIFHVCLNKIGTNVSTYGQNSF